MGDFCGLIYDAIIIPGGGLEPGSSLPQPWVRARLDEALKRKATTRYFIVLSRGTTHRPPPIDARHFPIDEAAASAKYLLDHGIDDASRVLIDSWSLDTIGNVFFARQMICNPMLLQKLLIITSSFHMPRTRAIFEWVFALDDGNASLDYCVTDDIGLNNTQLAVRIEKEQKSLQVLKESTIPSNNTLEKLSQFLFRRHRAYNAVASKNNRQQESTSRKEEKIKEHDSGVASTY